MSKTFLVSLSLMIAAIVGATIDLQSQSKVESSTPQSQGPREGHGKPSIQAIGTEGYTSRGPIFDRVDCFREEKDKSKTILYVKAYATFLIKDKTATLDLYRYLDDGSLKSISYTPGRVYKNIATFEIEDSITPPHLGPGPYMAEISATPDAGGAPVKTTYYYDTYSRKRQCWREEYKSPTPNNAKAAKNHEIETPVQGAISHGMRETNGHTEDQPGHQSDDDFPNCFKQNDTHTLVITVIADEIMPGNIQMQLHNKKLPAPMDPDPPIIQKGMAMFTFHDPIPDTNREHRTPTPNTSTNHLGPGPYVAVATVNTTDRTPQKTILHFPYDTYVNDPSECFADILNRPH